MDRTSTKIRRTSQNYQPKVYKQPKQPNQPKTWQHLELDIFIPVLKLGIEYQGKQHYEPIDFFGGLNNFKEQRKRDILKKRLCKQHCISIAYFKYDESMGEGDIINKIKTMVQINK